MKVNNKYGYKVCYKVQGKLRLKSYVVTIDKEFAELHIRWYANESPR